MLTVAPEMEVLVLASATDPVILPVLPAAFAGEWFVILANRTARRQAEAERRVIGKNFLSRILQ